MAKELTPSEFILSEDHQRIISQGFCSSFFSLVLEITWMAESIISERMFYIKGLISLLEDKNIWKTYAVQRNV